MGTEEKKKSRWSRGGKKKKKEKEKEKKEKKKSERNANGGCRLVTDGHVSLSRPVARPLRSI